MENFLTLNDEKNERQTKQAAKAMKRETIFKNFSWNKKWIFTTTLQLNLLCFLIPFWEEELWESCDNFCSLPLVETTKKIFCKYVCD